MTIEEGDVDSDDDDDVTDIVSFVAPVRNDSETDEPYLDISYIPIDSPLSSNINSINGCYYVTFYFYFIKLVYGTTLYHHVWLNR